jgi:hypothetical protein
MIILITLKVQYHLSLHYFYLFWKYNLAGVLYFIFYIIWNKAHIDLR